MDENINCTERDDKFPLHEDSCSFHMQHWLLGHIRVTGGM